MALIVQKFGGTSVKDTDRIKNVASRVGKYRLRGDQVVTVVSAMGGVTDQVNFSHPVYPTTPEVAWVVRQLQQRNLSHIVVQYFLHVIRTIIAGVSCQDLSNYRADRTMSSRTTRRSTTR